MQAVHVKFLKFSLQAVRDERSATLPELDLQGDRPRRITAEHFAKTTALGERLTDVVHEGVVKKPENVEEGAFPATVGPDKDAHRRQMGQLDVAKGTEVLNSDRLDLHGCTILTRAPDRDAGRFGLLALTIAPMPPPASATHPIRVDFIRPRCTAWPGGSA